MAQNDILNSDTDASVGNQSDIIKRITSERLGRRITAYRDHDKVHGAHYNNNIGTIVEEQQKQTSHLQLKSIETKAKKTNKKADKREHNLSLAAAGLSKNSRTLETDPEVENPGKKQKLNDGSAIKATPIVHQPLPPMKCSISPIPSPVTSVNLPPDLETSLSDINLPDTMGIKTEEGDFSSLSLNELAEMGSDISQTIMTYLNESIETEIVNNENSDLNDKSIFNNIPSENMSYTNSDAMCSQTSSASSFQQKNIPMNVYKKLVPAMNTKNENIPASQTLMHMAEVHQTKISPANCGRNMVEFNLGNYYSAAGGMADQNQIMPNYNHLSANMPMNEYAQNRRQQLQAAISPNLVPQTTSRTSTNVINIKNVPNQAVAQGHPNLKPVQNMNSNCSLTQTSQHNIPKKQSTSPLAQPQVVLSENHKPLTQPTQSQNGASQPNRIPTDNNPQLSQPQAGVMASHSNSKTQMKCIPEAVNKMPQYQNSVTNINTFNHTGPSVPSSSPFSTTFAGGNPNIRGAYTCQTRMPLQNHSQAGSHQVNPYMQGAMVNNSGIIRGPSSAMVRQPPPDYRQAAMMHGGNPTTPQDVGQMSQFHPASYRQNHQQPANQSLPPNMKLMNPNMAGYRAGAIQRSRPSGGSMNNMPMIQSQQNPNWMLSGNGMSNQVHVYQDINAMSNMQRTPQMPMRTGPSVQNINTNPMTGQPQCVQVMRGMRPDIPNNRHPMQMTAPVVGHMPAASTNAMNKQCQMQNVQSHNTARPMEAYSIGVNNNVHMGGNQMSMSNLSHGAMSKAQMTQMNQRQSPIGMQMNPARLPSQMMQNSPEMMQSVGGMNSQMINYQQNMSGHNSPLQVPNHINGLPSNNTMGHHIPNNVIMHNSNPMSQAALMSQIPDIKSEPNGRISQPSTPNTDFDPSMFNDGFSSLLK